ncbi:farnesol dehydrogenase isoform X2 [Drosophila ananassae]|uniref:farnesol dehydrogenase isoform X2 n=1 Tax=Drosophila ananassae TaxID=7217 RepID=UPI001CFFAEE1|nr:farnesol dehydrogenase isoform X2 [Drosophila ananassae]
MENFYWRNKVAVVTGASVGIGASTAVELANAGMQVVGLARRVELIRALSDQVTGDGKIHARQCDLSDEEQLTSTFAWIREEFHAIHVVICNAGILKANFLSESPTKDIKELFDTNVVATATCLREALKQMAAGGERGHIVVMNRAFSSRCLPDPWISRILGFQFSCC